MAFVPTLEIELKCWLFQRAMSDGTNGEICVRLVFRLFFHLEHHSLPASAIVAAKPIFTVPKCFSTKSTFLRFISKNHLDDGLKVNSLFSKSILWFPFDDFSRFTKLH